MTERKNWVDTFNTHRGYATSLMMHPVFGLIDAATTYAAISVGRSELNYLPKLIIDNLGVETFCLTRIAFGIGAAYAIEKYINTSPPNSVRVAAITSNVAHISNTHMAINNIPEMFFL